MQTDIHPDYSFITVTLADGTEFTTRSTTGKDYKSEVDSSNHPFYTGKKTMVDTAGRVEKFMRRYGRSQAQTVPEEEETTTESPAEQQAEAQEAIEQASAARAIDPGTPDPEAKTVGGPDPSEPVAGTAKPPASSPENPARDTEG